MPSSDDAWSSDDVDSIEEVLCLFTVEYAGMGGLLIFTHSSSFGIVALSRRAPFPFAFPLHCSKAHTHTHTHM